MNYSPEIGQQIVNKFHQKGWNMYQRPELPISDKEKIIRENLADKLCEFSHYVLLPVAQNPNDPENVMDTLEAVAVKRNREMPTITIGGEEHPITGFSTQTQYVKLHVPSGLLVSYETFLKAIDSVVQTME